MELKRVMLNAMLCSGGITALAGSSLGLALGLRPLSRVRAMQRAGPAIAAGRLDVRLPVTRSGDELDQVAGIVNAMMDEIERLMGEARTVGEGVAHELRTPLTRLRTLLDHAYDIDRDDARGQLLGRCIGETDSLLARFRALLRISAVEARNRRKGIAPISLSAVVEQVGELYQPVAAMRGIRLDVAHGQAVEVRADPELLFEAISNLVDNALKFTPPGGSVGLAMTYSADKAVIEVRDTGPGVPADEHDLVIKRFDRSRQKADVPGHGLGLALVSAVAALHGFDLSIEDACPGALFRLACPLSS